MRYKEYGETLQMGREKYGKMLRKAMIKCEKRDKMIVKSAEKRYKVQDFFRRSEGSLNAHFTQVCFILTSLSALLLPAVQTIASVNRRK